MLGCSGKEGVVVDVVDHSGIGSHHGVYRREEGEETVNTCKHMHNMTISDARGVLTQCYTILVKGNNIRESFLIPDVCQTDEPEGTSSTYSMVGTCGGRTGRVFRFVSSF